MNQQAWVRYHLSERGRKDSLRKGGNGKREQFQSALINPADLELFDVDEEGRVSFDATVAPKNFETDDKHHGEAIANSRRQNVLWDVLPTWDDLMVFVRWAHDAQAQADHEQYLEWEADEAEKKLVGVAFLADPHARAAKIADSHVMIEGHIFSSSVDFSFEDQVAVEAQARSDSDAEELKKANRATLAEWTDKYGTANQRQRLAAGLIPWQEVYDAAQEHLYSPVAQFPLYRRYSIEEVCECVGAGAERVCKVKFQSVDAVELTAAEWDRYSQIRAALPDATFQLREHRAECQIALVPQMKRGVIVKLTLGKLTFKREFALTEDSHDTL